MGRPVRLDFEGGWHHVMNRGAGRQPVFLTHGDGLGFERLLAEGCELSRIELHAYCLMSNHFHLLVRCPNGGLSEFMQRIGSLYTRRLNARVGRDGPLFRSRFRSIVVDTPEYLARVGRYIHRNPTDVPSAPSLAGYRWSSYRCYVGRAMRPGWLRTDTLLDMHHGDRRAYAQFVEADVSLDAVRTSILEPVIDMLLDECDPDEIGERRGLGRVIAIAMLQRIDGAARAPLEALLGFPSGGARRTATHRAERRLAETPVLLRVVERALDLAA